MKEQELTLLFYIASDNALAPLVVSEIKAIKDAGFQEDTTVLVYFDPMEKGAPTQLLDVNSKRKKTRAKKTSIGDGEDPFVRQMSEDEITDAEDLTPAMHAALEKPGSVSAVESLTNFIEFALEKREAKNYMLFTIGHGMIVGNDAFLPDDDPVSAITLSQLKDLCELFTEDNETSLRLLGLHSCSMSSIEVAYQLKGKADYMLATQGTMFVNGWPYRQLLKKTLKHVDRAKAKARAQAHENELDREEAAANAGVDYDQLIGKLYSLCLYNFTDFMTAGYSCDLSLVRLSPPKLEALREPLQRLVAGLRQGLTPSVSVIKDLVLLAHWEAQSFWSENYTDLWDFCDCLQRRCDDIAPGMTQMRGNEATIEELKNISGLCKLVKGALAPEDRERQRQGVVRRADNCGSEFQYARGLSIYFPWCEPLDDKRATFMSEQDDLEANQREARRNTVLSNYKDYDFTTEFEPSWFSFLVDYFKGTIREARISPESVFFDDISSDLDIDLQTARSLFERARTEFTNGVLKRTPELKRTPDVGGDCTCPSIKNYPIRPLPDDQNLAPDRIIREFSITPGALKAFLPIGDEEERDDE